MKTPMTMRRMMERVGVTLIEDFGVITAIDNQDKHWQVEAHSWDDESCQKMIKILNSIHQMRYTPPKRRNDYADDVERYLFNFEGVKK